MAAALQDCRTLSPDVRVQTRYLDLSPIPQAQRADTLKTLDFHANQLSRNSELIKPRRVKDDLLAVILADYGWSAATWDKLGVIDPYFHTLALWPGGPWKDGHSYPARSFQYVVPGFWLDQAQANELALLTGSASPLLRADWWFVQTSRQLSLTNKQTGAGYYDFLAVKNRDDFHKLLRFSEKDSVALGKELRAVVERSGVATQNRQIARMQALTGGYWVTLDTDDSTAAGNAVRLLDKRDYKHKAEEIYGVLPNGLFAYFLGEANGTRQDSAPDFIGPDDSPLRSGRDARIHVCLGCVRCHVDGLRPIDDWARRTLRLPVGLQAVDYAKLVELRRQYFGDLDRALKRDREVFAEAVREINGLTLAENARHFARLWDWYVQRDRTLMDIATEMGVDEERLRMAIAAYRPVDLVLSSFLAIPPQPVRVEYVEELMPTLWQIYLGAK